MAESVKIVCDAFVKNPDESWTAIKNTDVYTPDRSIRITSGMIFYKDRPQWGIDIVKELNENCQKQ